MVLVNVVLPLLVAFRKICLHCVKGAQEQPASLTHTPSQGRKRASTTVEVRIEIYCDYVRKIDANLVKCYHLNSHYPMANT